MASGRSALKVRVLLAGPQGAGKSDVAKRLYGVLGKLGVTNVAIHSASTRETISDVEKVIDSDPYLYREQP